MGLRTRWPHRRRLDPLTVGHRPHRFGGQVDTGARSLREKHQLKEFLSITSKDLVDYDAFNDYRTGNRRVLHYRPEWPTGADDSGIIFYEDVTKVHVMPDRESFTIHVLTPDVAVEMDFRDADRVRDALGLFETKKVSEVSPEVPNSVRITPLESEEQPIQK